MNRLIMFGLLFVVMCPGMLRAATEEELVKQVQDAIKAETLDAAEEALAAALKEFPESPRINALHYQLYLAQSRAEKIPVAVAHLRSYIDFLLAQSDKTPATIATVPIMVYSLSMALERDETSKPTVEIFDGYLRTLREKSQTRPGPELSGAIAELTNRKISWLAGHEQVEAAGKLLAAEIADASAAVKAEPNNVPAILRMTSALSTQSRLADDLAPEKADEYQNRQIEFLTEQLKSHKTELRLIEAYLSARVAQIYGVAPTDPDAADKILNSLTDFLKSFEEPGPVLKQRLTSYERSLASIPRRIDNYRDHLAMLGKKGAIPTANVWLNGGALSEGDLKGKVVLLDFWAVWCGPCIATFPHLREWREKYADKGFEIIGVTRYYNYDWDAAKKKIKRVPDLSNELENAATGKFLAHHNLKHHIAVMDKESGAKFSESYAVLGIPQAVLIDRQGNVRLIRVGSGKKNARALEQMIEQLLAENPAAAGK